MNKKNIQSTKLPQEYTNWLADIEQRIRTTQLRSTIAVNSEQIRLYWHIGHESLQRQQKQGWCAKIVQQIAHDLRAAFPGISGFSRANIMYMRAFAAAWNEGAIIQQAVGQLSWGHNVILLDKFETW